MMTSKSCEMSACISDINNGKSWARIAAIVLNYSASLILKILIIYLNIDKPVKIYAYFLPNE